jgi:uncharacterized membrane protein
MTNEFEAFAKLERQLGRLLLIGLTTASVLLAFGLVLLIAAPGGGTASMLLTTGLIILMATPMLRVVASLVEYVRMREWFFVLTTSVVFLELAAGVVIALRRS